MAFTYGSVTNCKTYNGQTRSEYQCRLGYEVQSQSVANNNSSVKLRLQVRSISSTYATYGYNQTTTIDGTALAAKSFDMRNTNTWQTFGERTITVSHNSEGKYSASKSGSFTTTGNSTWNLKSGSASVTVSPATIPRYATSNQSLKSKTSSSITMNWSSDNTIDYIWYSKDNGSNWTGVDVTDGTSGTYTISGLSSNTTYNIKTRVRRKDSQLTTDSSVLSVTTHYTTTATISVSSKTETSVTVSSSSNVTASNTRYRIMKSGGSYGNWQTSATFSGLSANSTYTVQVEKVGQASGEAGYATVSFTTYDYPYCTSAPDFVIGNKLYISIYNPLGRNCHCTMYGDDWSVIYSGDGWTGTSIGDFSYQGAVDNLYKSIPNKTSGKYHIKIKWDGVEKDKVNAGTYSTKGTEKPTFSDFEYEDTNSTIIALTGNNQTLINGYSNLKVTVSTTNKAVAKNSASVSKYRLNVGNMTSVEATYSSTAAVNMNINSVNSPSIMVNAIDSRGYSTQVSKSATFKSYSKPVISSVAATRSDGGVGSGVTLSFEGTWWNDSFGSVTNTIKSIKYYYKTTNSNTWTQGTTTITATVSGTKFSGNVAILGPSGTDKGFDIATAYNIKLSVTDALATSAEYQTTLSSGTPALAIYKSRVAINRMYDENSETALLVGEGGINLPAGNVDTINNAYKSNSQAILRHTSNGATVVSGALSGTDRKIYLRPGGTTEDSGQMTISTDGKVSITNEMSMSKNAPEDVYYRSKRTDTGTEIGFGVGSGGVNHGLWSYLLNKWMIYGDASNVYLNGNASTATNATNATNAANATTADRSLKPSTYSMGSDNPNTAGWYLIASRDMTSAYEDISATLLVTHQYQNNNAGIIRIRCRRDTGNATIYALKWLNRYGWNEGDIIGVVSGTQVKFYAYTNVYQWGRIGVTVLEDACRGANGYLQIHNSTSPTTGLTATITASDASVIEKSKSIVAAENDTSSYIVLGSLLVCWGNSTITPVKDTPTSKTINFPKSFSLKPVVICTPSTSVPGTTVTGVGANEITGTGCKLWITRTGTTSTSVLWIAIGQAS